MKTKTQLMNIAAIVMLIAFAIIPFVFSYIAIYVHDASLEPGVKPISYPEEIQIAKPGDTLIVSSVSDSIYIGFKH